MTRMTWRRVSSLVHLDLTAGEDIEGAAARAVLAGAVQADHQPDPRWRVLVDPLVTRSASRP